MYSSCPAVSIGGEYVSTQLVLRLSQAVWLVVHRLDIHTGQGQLVLTPVDRSCYAVAVLYSRIIFMCPFAAD